MNLKTKKLWLVVATSLVAFTSLQAADTTSGGSMKQGSKSNNSNGGVQGGYDLSLSAAALLWRPESGGSEYATGPGKRHVQNVGFDYDWGFRIGLGYTMPHDRWNVMATWDHMRSGAGESTASGWTPYGALAGVFLATATGAQGTALTGGTGGDPTQGTVSAHWHLDYDTVDLALKRDFQFSKWVCVAPHFGLRSAWIKQTEKFTFQRNTPNFAEMTTKNDFWGLGIRAGFDTQWGLGRGWSIYGNVAGALLYGNYHVNSVQSTGTLTAAGEATSINPNAGMTWSGANGFKTSRACGDFQLGLRWNKMFSDNRYGLTLQVGYEQHIYWNMFEATQPEANAHNGDLTFVGWTLAGKFDF